MTINGEVAASRLAPRFAERLREIARPEGTEADFRSRVGQLLNEVTGEIQIPLNVREEYHVARGRTDAVYNRLVIEYKRPGTLSEKLSTKSNQHAIQRVKDYIVGVAERERREAHRLAGVVMDGRFSILALPEIVWVTDPTCAMLWPSKGGRERCATLNSTGRSWASPHRGRWST